MKTWVCKVCGYTHQGSEAPQYCPECGASKSQFKQDDNGNNIFGILVIITTLATLSYILFACRSASTADNSAVKTVDLNKYLGKWYEIARFDHKFERNMTHCTATYALKDDGKITVTNKGMKNGKWKTSQGKAKTTDKPGVLRVSFFGPFYSDYRILMLAPAYSYALVGGSTDDYLWILSRPPLLSDEICKQIVDEASRRGYDTGKLIWVKQS